MATGTIKWFSQALLDLGNKIHNLSSDTLKLGLITTAVPPTINTAAPHWGGTGTTNFAANQVATGGTSYTAPLTMTTVTWTLVSNIPTLRFDIIVLNQDAAGATNIAYGILYNSIDANKRALAYIELSATGTLSLVAATLTLDPSGVGNDVLTLTQS